MIEFQGIRLYTVEELAKHLNIGVEAVRSLQKRGEIRYVRLKTKIYFSDDAIKEFLRGKTEGERMRERRDLENEETKNKESEKD